MVNFMAKLNPKRKLSETFNFLHHHHHRNHRDASKKVDSIRHQRKRASTNNSLNWPSGKAFVLYEFLCKMMCKNTTNEQTIAGSTPAFSIFFCGPCLLTIKSNSKLCSNLYALLFFCMSYTCILLYVSLTLDDFDFKPRRVSGLYHVHAKPTNAVQMEFKCARVFFRVR